MAQESKIWTRDFTLLVISRLIASSTFQMYLAVLGLFSLTKYGVSTAVAGLVTGSFVVGGLLIRLILGRWTDIWGRKRTVRVGSVVFLVCMIAYNFDLSLPALVILRVVHGISWGMATNTVNVVASSIIPRDRFGEGTSVYSIASTLGGGLGPFFALTMVRFLGYSALFLFGIVWGLIYVVVNFIVHITEASAESVAKAKSDHGFSFAKIVHVPSLPMAFVVFMVSVFFSAIVTFVESYSHEIGLADVVSWYFAAYTIGQILTRPLIGKVMDVWGDNIAMFASFAAYVLGMFIFSQMHTSIELIVAAVLVAAGFGCLFSGSQAIIARNAYDTQLTMAITTYFLFADAGSGVGPMIMGAFVPFLGYAGVYLACAILLIVLAGAYWFIHGRHAKRPKTSSGTRS